MTLDKLLVDRVLEGRQPSTVSSLLLRSTGSSSDAVAVLLLKSVPKVRELRAHSGHPRSPLDSRA